MHIIHTKITPIAFAPDAIAKAINDLTEHTSIVKNPKNITANEIRNSIFLMHNRIFPLRTNKKFIMYHSEPFNVDLNTNVKQKLVIAQYHATLPEYKNCLIVRNIINFLDKPYIINPIGKIKVAYSPSGSPNKKGKWSNKGFYETQSILVKLKKKYPNTFDYDLIHGIPLDKCIERKSQCSIVIDEVMTPSYHRSALEGLALGKITICKTGEKVDEVMKKSCGSDIIPFVNTDIHNLEKTLEYYLEKDKNSIIEEGLKNREWMEKYWHPQTIINEYIKIFESC